MSAADGVPETDQVAPTAEQRAPIAFIYDRATTSNRAVFQMRLEACGQFARDRRWEVGGWFADCGDEALGTGRRSGLDALLRCMAQAEHGRPRILLIYHWHRLSNDLAAQAFYARCVRLAGGDVRTVAGDTDGRHTRRGCLSALLRTS